jgi:hypothetical protein
MWNAKQHSYEELRDVVIDVLHQRISGNNQYTTLVEHTARVINQRESSNVNLGMGIAYQGAAAALHPSDRDNILEIFWDLFRQGVITLGLNDNNPQWPWFRLSRFGESEEARRPFRFHDTGSYIAMISKAVPDLLPAAKMYLEEAVAAFLLGLLPRCDGDAWRGGRGRVSSPHRRCSRQRRDRQVVRSGEEERFIRAKIEAFRKGLAPHLKTLPGAATEDLDINLNAVQSIIRIARNEAGHPSGASPPSREQVYANLQIFVHYADQVGRLRKELA